MEGTFPQCGLMSKCTPGEEEGRAFWSEGTAGTKAQRCAGIGVSLGSSKSVVGGAGRKW